MIRKAFVADKGNILLSADYSQIELRILAHLSGDPVMIEAFESKKDIHQETAARVFNLPLKEVTQEHRSKAKAVNFGVVYGMGAFKLSQDTGMQIKEAQMFIENYFNVYKGVRMYIEHEIEKVKRTQMTRNLFGRMRALPDINSERGDKRVLAEHMAVNTPIQGTAADLIKNAMIRIQNKINELKLHTRMVLQIHDELLFEVPEKELEQVKKMVKWEMENAMLLRVPLSVTIGAGKNWLDAH
ncbi:MAG: hypothetical protein ACD_79C00944G0001 [uncultured bacterium]|nr:MAG: hypothetical protein ACD_79C00944G0001 [uncultured bacterium]